VVDDSEVSSEPDHGAPGRVRGRPSCINERLRKAESRGSKSSNFALQEAVAIALPLATGLGNEALSYDFGLLV
jgi:hypothetical protein